MTMQKTFILGLGAQKSGTSWLYDYLSGDAAADFGTLKEYHIWDALTLPELAHYDMRAGQLKNRTVAKLISKLKGTGPDGWVLRGELQQDARHYFDYFEELLSQPGIHLTGDITPSYAGLTAETLACIRDGFAERNIRVAAVFLMRDPVGRAISAAQMNRSKRDWREGVPLTGSFDKAVLRYAQSKHHDLRANYPRTIKTMREVFSPEDCHLYLYEALFSEDALAELTQKFGVSLRPEQTSNRVYGRAKSGTDVSTNTRLALRQSLEPTYAYCAREFPESAALWATQGA